MRISALLNTGCLALVLLLSASAAQAEVYRWFGEDGRMYFGDNPPADSKPQSMELRVNTYQTPAVKERQTAPATHRQTADKKVVMYSASWCGVCKQARTYFESKNIRYTEYDVERSSKGRRNFKRLGGTGVPLIVVGEARMTGFSVNSFEGMYQR